MARVIKFRVWHEATKKYLENQYLGEEPKADYRGIWEPEVYGGLEQFTGLKDKNGKEIYEGDLLKNTHHSLGAVYFCDICSSFRVKDYVFGSFGINREAPSHYAINPNELEIYGNVNETPELIKK